MRIEKEKWNKVYCSQLWQVANIKWQIEAFKQGKKHIMDFIIKFEVLAMKRKKDNMYVIFLLRENVRSNIIKTILGYSPIAVSELIFE